MLTSNLCFISNYDKQQSLVQGTEFSQKINDKFNRNSPSFIAYFPRTMPLNATKTYDERSGWIKCHLA